MSFDVNEVRLLGHLGGDPEIRYTEGGKAVANVNMATSFGSKDNEKTEWHRLVLWEGQAEYASQYLHKGSRVYVEGRLQTRTWDKDGVTMYTTEIVAFKVIGLDARDEGSAHGGRSAPPAQKREMAPAGGGQMQEQEDDDLPF